MRLQLQLSWDVLVLLKMYGERNKPRMHGSLIGIHINDTMLGKYQFMFNSPARVNLKALV